MTKSRTSVEWNGEQRDVDSLNVVVTESSDGLLQISDGTSHYEIFQNGGKLSDGLFFDDVEIGIESDREALVKKRFNAGGSRDGRSQSGILQVKAPMPGLVRAIRISPGDIVEKGTTVIVLEAMKMENNILAPRSGKVASIKAQLGASVEKNSVLCEIESP